MFKQLHPNIRTRISISFLSRVIGSMIFPFMAIYFTKEMGPGIAGILLMVNIAVQFISSLYGGHLADLLGRKKMMVAGELIKVAAFAGMAVANSPFLFSPWITFFMMVIVSIASGFITPAAEAMLIDVSTPETRTFMYSVNYWATNMSIMIGTVVGGWFFQTHLFELLISLLVISFVTTWLTIQFISETMPDMPNKKQGKSQYGLKPLLKSYTSVITDIPFVLFILGGISILSIEFQRTNYISIRLAEEFQAREYLWGNFSFHLDGVKLLSLLTVENTVLIILFTAVVANWVKNKAMKPIMYIGFLLFAAGFMIFSFSNDILFLFIGVLILSIGELLYVPCRQSILADIVDHSRRGAYMAFSGFVFQIGKMIGAASLVLGKTIGGTGMAGFILILGLSGILFSEIALKKRSRTSSPPPVQPNISK